MSVPRGASVIIAIGSRVCLTLERFYDYAQANFFTTYTFDTQYGILSLTGDPVFTELFGFTVQSYGMKAVQARFCGSLT